MSGFISWVLLLPTFGSPVQMSSIVSRNIIPYSATFEVFYIQ